MTDAIKGEALSTICLASLDAFLNMGQAMCAMGNYESGLDFSIKAINYGIQVGDNLSEERKKNIVERSRSIIDEAEKVNKNIRLWSEDMRDSYI